MSGNPYFITGPALISFSGGRTSAYMLRMILDAHGGVLPDDVHVVFANTGKEREETLRFVHECATRWNVPVHWLEWRREEPGFEEVGYNSAHRLGEPFEALIDKVGLLPNVTNVFCSIELKQRTCRRFAASLGWGRYRSVVGLRADEPGRVESARRRNEKRKDVWEAVMPLAPAGVTQRMVRAWWLTQDFDLGLHGFEGNCDGCFQKGPRLFEVERYSPGTLDWWIAQEDRVRAVASEANGAQWINGRSYAEIAEAVRRQPDLFAGVFDADPDEDAECGLWCAEAACPLPRPLPVMKESEK